MSFRPTAIERAFELARSGEYAQVSDIAQQISNEDMDKNQITGPVLIAQLRAAIAHARVSMPKGPQGQKRPGR